MATRTITSPGVEIRERDLSLVAPNNAGTTVFVTGFANQGPVDEVIKITSREELDLVYGTPTNSPERYFYHTVSELLNSPANIYTSRIPYGVDKGVGFGSKYSALAYPVSIVGGVSGYDFTFIATSNIQLSAASISLTLGNNQTYTVGFSSATTGPALTSYDAYVQYTGTTSVTTSTLVNGLTSALHSLTPTATYVSAVNGVAVNFNTGVDTNYDFSNRPAGTTFTAKQGQIGSNLNVFNGTYVLGKPTHLELTEDEYLSIKDGSGFDWSSTATAPNGFTSVANLGGAGIIILNKAQTTINDQFEGYYIGISDNSNINPATDFRGIRSVSTVTDAAAVTTNYTEIPSQTLQFNLTAAYNNGPTYSVSELMENIADYDISNRDSDDLLNVGVFKLRKSIFATEAFKLDFVLEEGIVGSIDYNRTTTDRNGGPATNYYIGTTDDGSRNVEILVNDFISNRLTTTSRAANGVPRKKIRVLTQELASNNVPTVTGIDSALIPALTGYIGYSDSLFTLGAFTGLSISDKTLGDVPGKLDRVFEGVKNDDIYELDIVVEAGLGTIYAASQGSGTTHYDEYNYNGSLSQQVDGLRTSSAIDQYGETIRNNYSAIFNRFEAFCSPPYDGGGRGDCIFIADPIRQILVTGKDNKVASNRNTIFQKDIYWAMRHQFENENTSYAAAYGNWAKVYDSYIGQQVWVPFSGFAASIIASTDAARFPWIAPAGFTNGLVQRANDIAINPNQKQRDELYKVNINPISFFPSQGQVVFGQKTLNRKPSAFDRINVRRLFLSLERPTRKAAQFFVFEPNTTFTRTRLVNTLIPIFERARNNEGLYDYLIVCDERNNTPQVIDNNELVVDIYIKPVKSAEFVLVNFFATRTDASFREIIGA